jgi:thiosulfate/3-mercaptopyruvate sulfurtransferase
MQLLAVLLVACSAAYPPDDPKPDPAATLVTTGGLDDRLDDPRLRILDVRRRMDYEREHIPGAVHVDLRPITAQAALPGGLTDLDAWSKLIAPLGLEAGQQVVIYEGRRQLDAAKLWFLLNHLGVETVALLDGNYALWARENRPTDAKIPAIEPSKIELKITPGWLATKEEVRQAIDGGGVSMVDARSDREFTGDEAISGRGGRIPTARQLEWTDLVDTDGRFLPAERLLEILTEAGIDPSRPAIAYCHIGLRASVAAFALRRLGLPAQTYLPGWYEWGKDESCPIETGPANPSPEQPRP